MLLPSLQLPSREAPLGTSLVVQWLGHPAPSEGGLGLTPGQGTRSHMVRLRHTVVQQHSCVRHFMTHQASLSFTISQSLLKLMSMESVMPLQPNKYFKKRQRRLYLFYLHVLGLWQISLLESAFHLKRKFKAMNLAQESSHM